MVKRKFLNACFRTSKCFKTKTRPIEISFEPLPEDKWGTLSYIDDEGNDITKKVPTEIGDYGIIYDNLYDVIF